ncbi:MAG: MucR family transcriptional regulator [Candidatus Tectomicrobia bacterium]
MDDKLVEMCAHIVTAQASRVRLTPDDMVESLHKVFQTLQEVSRQQQVPTPTPESAEQSIRRNHVVCLECGRAFTLLSNRHLFLHGLTPRTYKRKHGLRMTQPLSARTLTAKRRKMARDLGMGKELEAWRLARKQQAG